MALHPRQQIGCGIETLAMREDFSQAGGRFGVGDNIGEHFVGIAVTVTHENEGDRIFRHRKTGARKVLQRVVLRR